jgi:hypothetical protein
MHSSWAMPYGSESLYCHDPDTINHSPSSPYAFCHLQKGVPEIPSFLQTSDSRVVPIGSWANVRTR